MNFQEITQKRRSINFFDPEKDVSEDNLIKMVEIAANTPSSFNLQPWNLMMLKDHEKKEKLKALAWDQPKVVEAPVVLIVLADMHGWKEGHPTFEKNWKNNLEAGSMQHEQREWFPSINTTV